MTLEWNVVVIGGGLSGRMAALAATEAGASVHVVAEAEDAVRHSSGLLDVLGYSPGGGVPIARPFDHLSALPPDHPYSMLGKPTIRAANRLLDAAVGDAFVGLDSDRNGIIVGPLGIPLVAFGYPPSVEPGLLSRPGDVLLVDVDPLQDFDAAMATTNLERAISDVSVDSATIDLSSVVGHDVERHELAHRLDREIEMAPERRTLLPELGRALSSVTSDADRVGLPAMLGIDRASDVRRAVADHVDASVFEVPTGPPSVLGIRLDRALDEAVSRTDALLTQGPRVVDFRAEDGRIEAVQMDREGATEWIRGRQFVLATGGFVGGGLQATRDDIVEPLFDCRVEPAAARELTAERPFDSQPFASVGLSVDDELRPVGADDTPRFHNLRAAGDVLGGFDPVRTGSAAGVAVATGYAAGDWAAEEGSS